MIDIETLKALCKKQAIRPTHHALLRLLQRNITLSDVEYALLNGEIIEQYPNDYPFPSCLVLSTADYPLHVVCSVADDEIWLVTAYRPDRTEWENDFKTRKEKKR